VPAFPRASPAAPAGSLEGSERLGRKTELQRDSVECKYQLNMHYHMPTPSRSVGRQHEPVGRRRSQELEARKSRLLPCQPGTPSPHPSQGSWKSGAGAPRPLSCPPPCHSPGAGTEASPQGGRQRRGAAASPQPPRATGRGPAAPPARGPFQPEGTEQSPHPTRRRWGQRSTHASWPRAAMGAADHPCR